MPLHFGMGFPFLPQTLSKLHGFCCCSKKKDEIVFSAVFNTRYWRRFESMLAQPCKFPME